MMVLGMGACLIAAFTLGAMALLLGMDVERHVAADRAF